MSIPMLRSLTLKNFRSTPAAKIEFDNPTFLVGQNGAGKSNITDVFPFLAEAMTSPLPSVLDRRGGLKSVGYRRAAGGAPRNLGLRIDLENLDAETAAGVYAFELRAVRSYGYEIVREQCVVTKRGDSRHWFDRKADGRLESSISTLVPALEPSALALPLIGGHERFQAVPKFLSEMRRYQIEPSVLRELQDPDDGMRLTANGANAASVLREVERQSPENWQAILDFLEHIVPHTVDIETRPVGNKIELEFAQEAAASRRMRFKAYNMSDGTLRALGLLAAVFQCSRPSLLALEEPEATIHPGAVGAVLDMLRHASRFAQVIVTTHSPDILDAKWIEDRHLKIVSWNDGETHASPLSDASRTALERHLMGAGEMLRSNALTGVPLSGLFVSDPAQVPLFEDHLL